jgi:hypothetical protein
VVRFLHRPGRTSGTICSSGSRPRYGRGSCSGFTTGTRWQPIDSHFPPPDKYTTDFDDYLSGISDNEAVDTQTRLKAAHELGALNGFKGARKLTMLFQINSAAQIAMKRYAHLANRFAQ